MYCYFSALCLTLILSTEFIRIYYLCTCPVNSSLSENFLSPFLGSFKMNFLMTDSMYSQNHLNLLQKSDIEVKACLSLITETFWQCLPLAAALSSIHIAKLFVLNEQFKTKLDLSSMATQSTKRFLNKSILKHQPSNYFVIVLPTSRRA